jgi:two-component system LytT family response regulator
LVRAKNEIRRSRMQEVDKRLEELLARVSELRRGSLVAAAVSTPEYAERIVVKAGGDLHFIKTSDVLWVEAQGDFVKVQTLEQPQLVRETLQSMEQKLDGSRFLRIHRSFLVNVQHIKRVAPALYGDHTVHMSDGSKLRLSRNYHGKLKTFIEQPPAT